MVVTDTGQFMEVPIVRLADAANERWFAKIDQGHTHRRAAPFTRIAHGARLHATWSTRN